MAKAYSQQLGVYYIETFALVACQNIICAIITLAAQKQWKIYQLYVKFAFINGCLQEDICRATTMLHH